MFYFEASLNRRKINKNMINTYMIITAAVIIGFFSEIAFSQCPKVLVPPYTDFITGTSNATVDFELKKGKDQGVNDLIFYPDGFLKYKGQNFMPSVYVASGIKKFMIYENYATDLGIAIPKSNASKTLTTFYILNKNNCTSRKVTIGSLSLDKVFWAAKNSSVVTLCESEGKRFAQVNTKTGRLININKSRTNPCKEN